MSTLVRNKLIPQYGEGQTVTEGVNPRGEQLFAQALPPLAELTRQGFSFGAQIPTASAFTFVASVPTTRAELVIWNGESAGGKSYVIDRVWLLAITSMAASQPLTLLGQVVPASLGVAAPTDNAAVLRSNNHANSAAFPSLARFMLANTAFAVANQWRVLASATPSPTTNLGAAIEKDLNGRYIVPPGGAFCLAGLAGTAAGTAVCGIEYHELVLPF